MRWPQSKGRWGHRLWVPEPRACPQRRPGTQSIPGGTHALGGDRVTQAQQAGQRHASPHTHGVGGMSHTSPHSPGVPSCVPTPPGARCSPCLSSAAPQGHRHRRCPPALTVPTGSPHVPMGPPGLGTHPPCPPQRALTPHPPPRRARARLRTRVPLCAAPIPAQPGGRGGGREPGAGGRAGLAAGSAAGEYFWSAPRSFQSCDEDII